MNLFTELLKNTLHRSKKNHPPIHGADETINMTRVLINPRKILIIPYNRMGTVLLVTRLFTSLREFYADAEITAVVHQSWSVLIQNDPTIDQVITFDDWIEDPFSKQFQALGKELAEQQFDLAFYLSYQFDTTMAYLARLSNATLRISFKSDTVDDYFNVAVSPTSGDRYEVDRYLEMLHTFGISGSMRNYTLSIGDTIREKARMRFLPAGPVDNLGRLVGFDLTREIVGDHLSRKHAEQMLKTLIHDMNTTVVVFFEPEKRELAAELKELFGKSIILVEDRPVSMMAGVLSYCRFVVAHNTDLLQLTIALKTPTIAVLTPEEMRRWSPGENSHLKHLECSESTWPASRHVVSAAKKLIQQTKSGPG